MSYSGIFVLIFAIISIHKVQSECSSEGCNSDVCNDVCEHFSMNGTCVGGECCCSTAKKCIDYACDKACSLLKLKGECDDNDQCICKPELDPCSAAECEGPCIEDAPPGCLIVLPDFCLDYGPIRTCSCICITWFNQFIHFGPAKANMLAFKSVYSKKYIPKKMSELDRKHYRILTRP